MTAGAGYITITWYLNLKLLWHFKSIFFHDCKVLIVKLGLINIWNSLRFDTWCYLYMMNFFHLYVAVKLNQLKSVKGLHACGQQSSWSHRLFRGKLNKSQRLQNWLLLVDSVESDGLHFSHQYSSVSCLMLDCYCSSSVLYSFVSYMMSLAQTCRDQWQDHAHTRWKAVSLLEWFAVRAKFK